MLQLHLPHTKLRDDTYETSHQQMTHRPKTGRGVAGGRYDSRFSHLRIHETNALDGRQDPIVNVLEFTAYLYLYYLYRYRSIIAINPNVNLIQAVSPEPYLTPTYREVMVNYIFFKVKSMISRPGGSSDSYS